MLLLLACAPEPVAVSGLSAELHEEVGTLIEVSWNQDAAAESWVVFGFEGEEHSSPVVEREAGATSAWLLGAPAGTEVAWRVVTEVEGVRWESAEQAITTDPAPDELPPIEVPVWEPELAHEAGWVFGSVDVDGGDAYSGPFWLFLADREGRYVWWRDLEYHISMFPRASDTHLAWEDRIFFDIDGIETVVHRATLDGSWSEDTPTPGLGWTWDETDQGTIVYDRTLGTGQLALAEVGADGEPRIVWDCSAWLQPLDDEGDHCFTNATNWDPERDTVLWSTYWGDFVVEIERETGEVLWYAGGGLDGGLDFDPPEATFDLQHYPSWTPDGTLLVSTHIQDVEGEQRAREFELDLEAGVLTEIWSYGEGVDEVWAKYSGEAVRLDNGNTVQNYGTGGEVREVTSSGEVAWSLRFGDGYTIGHTDLITDLYALNEGRE